MSQTISEAHLPELQRPLNDRYQVQELLSARLWVRVYRAQDLQHPKQAACVIRHIKAMPIVPNYHDVMRGLLANEAMILSQVSSHPQIPYQLDFFEDEHGFYLVQELVAGQTLAEELRSQPEWGVDAVLNLLRELAEPLAWLHRFGGMHGNLKPDNILHREADGRLVLIDFHGMDGLQRAVMAAHGIEIPPQVAAQQGYQPLEQLQGLPCAASDVYALGIMAVQAWTGMNPVDFQMDPETAAILWQAHVPPSHHPLHAGLMQILENMVQWDLPQRYANADQVLLALNDLQPGLGGTVATPDRSTATTAAPLPAAKPRIAQVTPHPAIAQAMVKASPDSRSLASRPTHPPVVDAEVISVTAPPAVVASHPPGTTVGMKSWLEQTLTSPSLRAGAGGMAVATTFAAVGWGLLNSVDWSAQTNTLWSRFMPVSDTDPSPKYRTVKTLTEQWRQDWQQATRTMQQAEMALNQREWSKARQLAMTMPDIPYWRDRGAALVQEVSTKASNDATLRLQEAFDLAQGRQFTKALALLNTMAQEPDNPLLPTIQAKQKEYREKENIKAWFDLQQAYDHAVQQNFGRALDFLYQIPPSSTAYPTAQAKVTEYKEKLRIQAATPVLSAVPATAPAIALTPMSNVEPSVTQVPVSVQSTPTQEQAQLQQQTQLATALATLETSAGMPQGSDAQDQAIAQRIQLQRQALNQQAAIWLHKAEQQAQAGQLEAAIATLSHVPLGTTAYAQARDRIQTLTAQLQAAPQPIPVATARIAQETASTLRQTQPLIIGRATLRQIP